MKLHTLSSGKLNRPLGRKVRKGFSIIEVAIAMGVVTLLLTTFLGVFGPAQKNIQRALSTSDANRMKDELTKEMSVLRTSDADASSFHKAFRMTGDSHTETSAVLVYQYKANPVDNDDDGIIPAYTGAGIQGQDYIMQTAVRTLGVSPTIQAELAVIEGPVFVVRMTQLVDGGANNLIAWSNNGDLKAGITDPDDPGAVIADPGNYPKAGILFRAEFFKLAVNKYAYVNGGSWDFAKLGKAVSEVNMAVNR